MYLLHGRKGQTIHHGVLMQTIWHCYTTKSSQHEQTPYLNLVSEEAVHNKCTMCMSTVHSNLACHHTAKTPSFQYISSSSSSASSPSSSLSVVVVVIIIIIIIISNKQHQNIAVSETKINPILLSKTSCTNFPGRFSHYSLSRLSLWLHPGLPPTVESCNSAGTEAGKMVLRLDVDSKGKAKDVIFSEDVFSLAMCQDRLTRPHHPFFRLLLSAMSCFGNLK